VKSFVAAVAFLTRIPVGRAAFETADVAQSAGWFPLIGILLGIVYAGAAAAFKGHLPVAVIAVLLIILDALATGALHFDGLADTADGFGGGKAREDTLRIMRDHAIGSYGGLALAAIVALKVTAYSTLLSRSDGLAALILTPALGRWSILLLTAALPYARTSPSVAEGMGKRALLWGTPMLVAAMIPARSWRVWIAMAVVIAVSAAFGFCCRRRIAGVTGDTLGANLQLCESAALLTFLWAGHTQ
jgi:adenosylcobinamide-GDP ribazoletransferase